MVSITRTAAPRPESISGAKLGPAPSRRFPPLRIADTGKVRLGGQGPIFRAAGVLDTGKVRIGGQGPIFR